MSLPVKPPSEGELPRRYAYDAQMEARLQRALEARMDLLEMRLLSRVQLAVIEARCTRTDFTPEVWVVYVVLAIMLAMFRFL